jgi:hypothetical protein
MALACFGLVNIAQAGCRPALSFCASHGQCCSGICIKFPKSKTGQCSGGSPGSPTP